MSCPRYVIGWYVIVIEFPGHAHLFLRKSQLSDSLLAGHSNFIISHSTLFKPFQKNYYSSYMHSPT